MPTRLLDHPPRARGRSRLLRAALRALAATGIAIAVAGTATAAPVGVPVPPGGHATGWGKSDDGRTTAPDAPSGQTYTAVAAGASHSLALTADGHVKAWGSNRHGQLTGAPTAGGYTAIAAGDYHSLALTADGHIKAWGNATQAQLYGVPTDGGYTAIAAGTYHSLALTADGHIKAWGNNYWGQNNGVPTGGGYTAIAAGDSHSLALTSDGRIETWGNNNVGRPGMPTGGGHTAIAAGFGHSLALTADGHIKSWGQNNGAPTGSGYTAIAASTYHSLALTADGHIKAWGNNNYGQLDGVPTGSGYTAIAANTYHSLAVGTWTAPGLTGGPPAATVGQPYHHAFTVLGNPGPAVTVTAGELPPGLSLTTDGVLSGTPTAPGTSTFTVTATNDLGTATLDIEVTVQAAPAFPGAGPITLNGAAGTDFAHNFEISGSPTPWVYAYGNVPPGLWVQSSGLLSGTPTTPGTYTFTVYASNSVGYASRDVTLTITAAPAFTDAGPIPLIGIAGTEFTHDFANTGYPKPAVTATGLPAGLALSDTGVLSGTPTTPGTYTFTVTATNSVGTATRDVSLTIAVAPAAPMFTDAGPVTLNAVAGTPLARGFTVTGSPTPSITVLDDSTLPPGTTFTDGVLSGTPTVAGTYTFTLTATNGVGTDLTLDVTVLVTAAPVTPEPPTAGSLGSLAGLFGF